MGVYPGGCTPGFWMPPAGVHIPGSPGDPALTHFPGPISGPPGTPDFGVPGAPRGRPGKSAHFGGYLITLPFGTEWDKMEIPGFPEFWPQFWPLGPNLAGMGFTPFQAIIVL